MSSEAVAVSAIIAARDAEATIARAVRSLLCQSCPPCEVIVVDDGSRDETADRAQSVGETIRVVRLPRSVGRGAARNVALEHAAGDLVAVLDADDVALPDRLQHTLELFRADAGLIAVSGQARFMSRSGAWRLRGYPLTDREIRRGLERGEMTMCHPAATIRRDALLAIGGYRTHLIRAQDYDLMRRLLPVGRFANSPHDFIEYHHPVLLSFAYWRETRRGTWESRRGVPPPPRPVRDSARYALAMGRRSLAFVRTAERT